MPNSELNLATDLEGLTAKEANRRMCADYLRNLARMIEDGGLDAFSLTWVLEGDKIAGRPEGKIALSASFLSSGVEQEIMAALEKHHAKIQVVDMTNELKD